MREIGEKFESNNFGYFDKFNKNINNTVGD